MLASQVSIFPSDGTDSTYDAQAVVEITDKEWCEDDRGPGWFELAVPLADGAKLFLRLDSHALVRELRRVGLTR